ncbi:hypothetical protein EN871_16900 [bacterium M00.F.Ca.ET.228.01.1.1]|nr:hypothetical protein EN871_16900 [bacterium M00.F.Ca.ET.228.01.1.1]TGS00924.1 hypothetical protein EN834_16895 [bacterium M00.F.Ca.ET.191.01.1.1]TGU05309.1 hypothetical protein EN798_17715 [bacterium M00.F.Ca.ET.155.01.1.1]
MVLNDVIERAVAPALAILPTEMDTPEARVMLLAIGLQESRFSARQQLGGGPARGFWQCEQGSAKTRGGVWGFYLHPASRYWISVLCRARGVAFDPVAIYGALDKDDVLAAGVARLGLFTDPKPLPSIDDVNGSWALYQRVWRPGKPKPDTWPALHAQAVAALGVALQ